MYYLLHKDGVVKRTVPSPDVLTLVTSDSLPVRPQESAGQYKRWELHIVDGAPVYVAVDRPMTDLEQAQARIDELETALVEVAGLVGGEGV